MQVKQHSFLLPSLKSWTVWLIILTYLTGCANYPWPVRQMSGSPEQRVEQAQAELNKDMGNTNVRKTLRLEKESAIDQLLTVADQARSTGNYQQAMIYYDRLLELDSAHGQAQQLKMEVMKEKDRASKMVQARTMFQEKQYTKASELVREILIEKPDMAEANQLQIEINEESHQSKIRAPHLKPISDRPITLELRDANIKVVFEALSRATGINFVLDKDIKPDTKTTIFIKKMQVEDAIDMVLSSNGLAKKALSENSALVFPNTTPKIKDYQDLMIRSFYLTNTTAKEVSIMLKTMLKTKDIYIDERLNMLVMRDTPEIVNIAEKLVQANDMADPEVMLDIEVLEVSRTRLQELGIIYPNQLAVIGANTGLTLEALRNVTSANIGVRPNPSLNFNKTTGDVNLLSNPRIRVKNNEKAKVLVGDKVPIINTTATANGVVAENVTYVDVGLKLDVEPRINLDNYVNIKVGLEVSSLGEKTTTKAGGEAYTIGTRNANTVLRLKHGETQILAGLILDDERKSSARLPGLGDLPVLGRLFSNQSDRKSKTEIVLAITPRILSNIQLPKADIAEYWTGTESLILDHPRISMPASNSGAKSSISTSPSSSPGEQTLTPTPSVDTKESNSQAPSSNLNNPAQANGNVANKSPTQESPISNTQPNINTPKPSSNAAASSSGGNQNLDVLEMIKRSKEIIESQRLKNAADPNAQ